MTNIWHLTFWHPVINIVNSIEKQSLGRIAITRWNMAAGGHDWLRNHKWLAL